MYRFLWYLMVISANHASSNPGQTGSLKVEVYHSSSVFKKITCWFYTNKLSINVKKCKFIIFRPRQNWQTLDLAFNISNYSIDRARKSTFLGVILDEHLTRKSHIHNVVRKVSKAIGIHV